jgi:hypothetical protein
MSSRLAEEAVRWARRADLTLASSRWMAGIEAEEGEEEGEKDMN